jgi:hypothetical protein
MPKKNTTYVPWSVMLHYYSVTSIAMTSRNITNEDTPDERRGDLEREYL